MRGANQANPVNAESERRQRLQAAKISMRRVMDVLAEDNAFVRYEPYHRHSTTFWALWDWVLDRYHDFLSRKTNARG
jgi:hypothetical protein